MTNITEIRERLSKVTPGPWRNEGEVIVDEHSIVVGTESYNWRFVAQINSDTEGDPSTPPISTKEAKCNADFIANAPNDIAYLLAALSVARTEIERLRKEASPNER